MAENVRLTDDQIAELRDRSVVRCQIINGLQRTISDFDKATHTINISVIMPLREQVRKELEAQRKDSAAIWVSANNVKRSACWINDCGGEYFAPDLGSFVGYMRDQYQTGQCRPYFVWNDCLYDAHMAVATGECHLISDVCLQDLLPD